MVLEIGDTELKYGGKLANTDNCFKTILFCLVLDVIYVGSLYIWKKTEHRDHPTTVKKRFISVFAMAIISPFFTYFGTDFTYFKEEPGILKLLGIRWSGCFSASTIPLLLTMILFLGPLVMHYIDGICAVYLKGTYWSSNLRNLIWIRNHIVEGSKQKKKIKIEIMPKQIF